ncbi:GNAT family N-acetyltransferase [Sphingomicrobium aestuariivivum]|uniref:GNAT family N-acetyltransferase n=1 Tax=Sphingomicrobium aestuariivivum TaxID=1582356 RepID=UPI001FD6A182|nr:GNAT family N-acetyltransferase [Sphingomicrobium aestuariivivum]MCJ8191661.1 GNAT family N-acetyltransferase [Sphingomicrobium aestuariivivum]
MITIRREQPDDAHFIEALDRRLAEVIEAPAHDAEAVSAFQRDFTASRHDASLGEQATFVALGESGERLGYVNVRSGRDEISGDDCGYIALLAVAPEAEGKGVARRLTEGAEDWSREQGHQRLALDVFASNRRALAFYEKQDFAPETLRMIKRL